MELKCLQCQKILIGKQRKFCSHQCNDIWWLNIKTIKINCSKCGKTCSVSKDSKNKICRSCINKNPNRKKHSMPGDKNPNWKGGHTSWKEGRYGKDKDGLSWITQRKLAWARDKNTCRNCGKIPAKRKTDVHHINPYRFSFSHALDNLICLCASCHKKEEAKDKRLWNGETFGGHLRSEKLKRFPVLKKERHRCIKCNKPGIVLNNNLECRPCAYERIYPIILLEYNQGIPVKQLMEKYNISERTVFYWIKNKGFKYRGNNY